MNELPSGERVQGKWPRRSWKRDGAAVATSGLKHGVPRDLLEGRAKLSIQSCERPTSPANPASRVYDRIYYFSSSGRRFDVCATATAIAGGLRGTAGGQSGRFAAWTP